MFVGPLKSLLNKCTPVNILKKIKIKIIYVTLSFINTLIPFHSQNLKQHLKNQTHIHRVKLKYSLGSIIASYWSYIVVISIKLVGQTVIQNFVWV